MGFIVKGGGGTGTGGTTDHNALTNKNLPNQHTIDAITGLLDELGKRPQTTDVNVMINSIIDGAPEAYNTLKEIADYIAQDQSAGASILSALGNKVDKEAGKGLSSNDYDDTAKSKVDNLNITQVVDLDAVKNASHTHANTSILGKIGESAGGNITYNNEIIFKNDADQINNTPAGNITASNVQAALNELDSKKLNEANAVSTYGYHYRDVVGYSTTVGVGANTTGTLKITLPTSGTNSTLKLRVEGFNSEAYGGNWHIELQGVNLISSAWLYTSAILSPNCPFTSVRFGHDGAKCCILLGTTGTVWQYPQITISDVYASYEGYNQFATGWALSFITNETGITTSSTPNVKNLAITDNITASGASFSFSTDNAYSFGTSGKRATQLYAATATINTSDRNAKKDITETQLGLDFINKLKPVEYKYKVRQNVVEQIQDGTQTIEIAPAEVNEKGEVIKKAEVQEIPTYKEVVTSLPGIRTHLGLIAQEVEECLGGRDIAIVTKDENGYGLRYEELIAPLIKAVQELSAEVAELRNNTGK